MLMISNEINANFFYIIKSYPTFNYANISKAIYNLFYFFLTNVY